MVDQKLNDDDKANLQKSLKDATLTEKDIVRLAEGEDEFGTSEPVESEEDIISAAATALEFVEDLDSTQSKAAAVTDSASAVAGFDALLRKLESMRGDIAALQRSVVGIFAAQLLTFRGKVVDLKSIISDDMVEKLRMPMFKNVIESTFVDIVDSEFATMEKELVDRIVDETQEKFKEFATRVRESENDLRATIVQQQDVVRSFMQSLEEETFASTDELKAKDNEIKKLEARIVQLQKKLDETRSIDVAAEEMNRQIVDLEAEVSDLRDSLFKKDTAIEEMTKERDEAKIDADETKMQLAEIQSQLDVYKKSGAEKPTASATAEAEVKSLQSKVNLLEKALDEKRAEAEGLSAKITELERNLVETQQETKAAEKEAKSRLKEIESMQGKFSEVKELEQKVYDLQNDLKEAEAKVPIVEMQREAFEKAARLMEKERDMALEIRDLAEERAKRYIKVLKIDASTRVLLLVDEVGKMSFTDLGKSLGISSALAAKHAREMAKLGVLKVDNEMAISTLKDIDVKEGEVKVD
jgi:predicted  nucleic acid-binding Zn-ribbon protein